MGRSSRSATPDEFPFLKELGLKATSILGDGNCLFNALSDQIYGDQSYHQEIRATVVKYMRDNGKDFKDFVPVEAGGGYRRNPKRKNVASAAIDNSPIAEKLIEENWNNYLHRMAQNATYGDNLEIRAFSKAYNIDVRIYTRANSFVSHAATDGFVRPTAHIALHTYEHYSSVRNICGPATGLPNIVVNETTELLSSVPSTPCSSFSSSGSSSVERDLDSDEEKTIYGPNKKTRSPPTTKSPIEDADIPALSLAAAPEKKLVKIILHLKPQPQQGEQLNPHRRLVTAREYKQMKKLEQKRNSKERKKEAARQTAPSMSVTSSKASPSLQPVSGMKTLTI